MRKFLRTLGRWCDEIGSAVEASHRGQRDQWAADPSSLDTLEHPDRGHHRKGS